MVSVLGRAGIWLVVLFLAILAIAAAADTGFAVHMTIVALAAAIGDARVTITPVPPLRPIARPPALDRRIINALQGGFPISDEPYREVADSLGTTEAEVLASCSACSGRA